MQASTVVGYFNKPWTTDAEYGMLPFQWEAVDGQPVLLNSGYIKPTVVGTMYNHGVDMDMDFDWWKSAPEIQIRKPDGGYVICYYGDDFWDDELCADNEDPDGDGIIGICGWGTDAGEYDKTTTLTLGGCAWVKTPAEDGTFTIAGAVATEETAVGGDASENFLMAGAAFPVSFKLNGPKTESVWSLVPGTMYNHGVDMDMDFDWWKNAPQIQVRKDDGGYIICYYGDDFWDDDLCADNEDPDGDGIIGIAGWGTDAGEYDKTTVVNTGVGFWLTTPTGDKTIYLTVKNPIKK